MRYNDKAVPTNTTLKTRLASALAACLFVLAFGTGLHAQSYSVVHRFSGPDGASPYGLLIVGPNADLYGMTRDGGANSDGVLYQVSGTTERVLYSFRDNSDGINPVRGLIMDPSGNLYGTTPLGGSNGSGAVFKFGTSGTESVIYSFTGGTDGEQPQSALTRDAEGNLYGTTVLGGKNNRGTVFRLRPDGALTTLHSFSGGKDGEYPFAGMIRDGQGNLYGTTGGDGATNWGTVFEVTPAGHEIVLYAFRGGADGGQPMGPVIRDTNGNIYGTTYQGGSGAGVVFRINRFGGETVLYSFAGRTDGANPLGGLVMDAFGDLYGTTENGGTFNFGAIFEVTPKHREIILHSFGEINKDGKYPETGLAADTNGNMYGATYLGGTGSGLVFKLIP